MRWLVNYMTHWRERLFEGRRVAVPTVLQLEIVECGPACLAMILGFFGRWVTLEELRKRCGVSRDGSTAANILRAARHYGLVAEGYQRELDELQAMELPVVVFWNFNHYVVVTGFSKKYVYLCDPSSGNRRVSHPEFSRCFTGIVLSFKPSDGFLKTGSPPSLTRGFRDRLSGSWNAFTYIVVITALLVVPGVVIPAIIKNFVDQYLVLGLVDWLRPLLLAMGIATLLNGLMTWLQQRYLLKLQVSLSLRMGGSLVRHLLRLPAEFFSQRFAGDLNARVQSVTQVASVLSGNLSANLVGIMSAFFYALIMLGYSVRLTAIGIAIATINLVATRLVWAKRRDANRVLLKAQAKVNAVTTNGLQNIESIKSAGGEQDLFERWSGAQAYYVSVQQNLNVANAALGALPSVLGTLGNNLVLCFGAYQVIAGRLTIGDLIAFQTLFGAFNAPIQSLVSLSTTLPQTSGYITRIDDVQNYKPRDSLFYVHTSPKPKGHLELRNVTFGYSVLAPPLISDLSLSVTPGQRVAVVGRSGSGKSTIVRLAAGLFEPWSGEILLDGVPIHQIDPVTRANFLSMVDQEIVMFAGTAKENITLWDRNIPDADILSAARDALIHDVIAARPGNYSGAILEAARNFSGGERQRIEIARALVLRPSLLLMDEATSALDPIMEKQIDENIRRRGCGCLIVAHRLSTVRDCEEILVMRHGRVVQRGTHEYLMREGGEYARLVNNQ
jgi:NHLM bacteriocin system ABC transporter peptidase/ATP-binding protein